MEINLYVVVAVSKFSEENVMETWKNLLTTSNNR